MATSKIEVLSPAGTSQVVNVQRAKRPDTFEGIVVGFLDNTKNNADRILGSLEQSMKERYGVKTISAIKETSNRPGDPALLASMAARCHVFITGIGD